MKNQYKIMQQNKVNSKVVRLTPLDKGGVPPASSTVAANSIWPRCRMPAITFKISATDAESKPSFTKLAFNYQKEAKLIINKSPKCYNPCKIQYS